MKWKKYQCVKPVLVVNVVSYSSPLLPGSTYTWLCASLSSFGWVTHKHVCRCLSLFAGLHRLVWNWKVPIVLIQFTAGLQSNKWDLMNLMRTRGTTDVYYPEAMRHIVRKRTAANKTVSQNNADILSWSAGWLLQFFFFLFQGKREDTVCCSHFEKIINS